MAFTAVPKLPLEILPSTDAAPKNWPWLKTLGERKVSDQPDWPSGPYRPAPDEPRWAVPAYPPPTGYPAPAAYALPVAATDVGGVSGVVQGGAWGLLLPPQAPAEAYADWLAALFLDRTRYRAAALHAREDYETRLSNRAYTRQLLGIISRVCDSARKTMQPANPPVRPRPPAIGVLRSGEGLTGR